MGNFPLKIAYFSVEALVSEDEDADFPVEGFIFPVEAFLISIEGFRHFH